MSFTLRDLCPRRASDARRALSLSRLNGATSTSGYAPNKGGANLNADCQTVAYRACHRIKQNGIGPTSASGRTPNRSEEQLA